MTAVELIVDEPNLCVQDKDKIYIANGAIVTLGHASLNKSAGALAMTLADPGVAGKTLIIIHIDTGTYGHTVTTATGAALDGTNNRATLNAKREMLVLRSISATEWIILANVGGVVLTAV